MNIQSVLFKQKSTKILIVGAGISGRACAQWLSIHDCYVDMIDSRKIELKNTVPKNVSFYPNLSFSNVDLQRYTAVIVSPGLSPNEKSENNIAVIKKTANSFGIPIWTEVDLFFSALEHNSKKQEAKPKILAVTGTNGKTTVVTLAADLLRNLGYDIQLAGNIGKSLLEALMERARGSKMPAVWILELSSFQLFYANSFAPDASVILNFSSDHLDWHCSEEEYLSSKLKVFGFPHLSGVPIINTDDTSLKIRIEKHISSLDRKEGTQKPIYFGLRSNKQKVDFCIKKYNGEDWFCMTGERENIVPVLKVKDSVSLGKQNRINLLATFSLCSIVLHDITEMSEIDYSFKLPNHRMEEILIKDNLRFLNDSKATNINATMFALDHLSDPLLLILGGDLKKQNPSPLVNVLRARNVVTYVYGKDKHYFRKCFEKYDVEHFMIDNVKEAVVLIKKHLDEKNSQRERQVNILLSPACSSKDQYKDYAERGNDYQKAVISCFAECEHA